MKKLFNVWLLLLCIFSILDADDFDVDYAAFRGNETIDILEAYIMIPRGMFEFVADEGAFCSNILIRAALAANDTVIDWKQWTLVDRIADTTMDISSQQIPEIVTFQAAPGEYQLIVLVADQNTKKKTKVEKPIELPVFDGPDVMISDIHMASQMTATKEENKFAKYFGYDMIPHANLIFGEEIPTAFSYCEVYNMKYDKSNPGIYTLEYKVTDINDNTVMSIPVKEKQKPGESSVEVNGVNVGTLKAGIYDLTLTVTDNATQKQASKTKRFYIVKKNEENILQQVMADNILKDMSEEELDELFGPMQYLATNTERKQFRRSDIEGKRQIILNFWKNRDSDPVTEMNETKHTFDTRLAYANQQYGSLQRKGWETDRGRVLILYGYPSDIDRHPSSLENRPYEIWYYNDIEGGVQFVFVDKTGFGILELVHSTARNELQDSDWQRWINEGSSSTNSYEY